MLLIAGAATAAYFLSRPKHREVPAVVGQNVKVADTILANEGFKVAIVHTHSRKPAEIVTAENPTGGSQAVKGSTVTLTVSRGRGDVSVPSVQGATTAAATKQLAKLGLKVARVIEQSSKSVSDGEVIRSSPPAATSVPRGTAVVLYVSTGPPQVKVPGVVGDTSAGASQTLTAAGFNPNTTSEVTSSSPAGTVVSQTPGANATATVGSTVTIVIARAPAKLSVPPVTGQQAANAITTLTAAGFHVSRTYRTVTDASKSQVVVSQSPPGGSQRARDSTVSIVVGTYHGQTSSSTTSSTTTSSSSTSKTKTSPGRATGRAKVSESDQV